MKNKQILFIFLLTTAIFTFLGFSYLNSQYKFVDKFVSRFYLNKLNSNPFLGKWRLSKDTGLENPSPDYNLYITFKNDNVVTIENDGAEASDLYSFEENILKIGATSVEGNVYEFIDSDNFSILTVYPDGYESKSYFQRIP